ncbi:MAG: DUF4388 domain-containing protein [Deltaproteobacteria bacterium]|nr:DUF4388 domain-containing protein [Deltaproteobacteria bacterium]
MSISGSLEDVSVSDVMQFIHLGRRTGTLMLARGSSRAMIGFHEGRLISAQGPTTPKLGDLLVRAGAVDEPTLQLAIQQQEEAGIRKTLGQILIAQGAVEEEGLRQVISEQIESTVSNLVSWENGTFEFAVDDLTPIDEIAVFPADVVPGTDMNTQMVLLEAARIFDERNRAPAEASAAESELDDTHPVLPSQPDAASPQPVAAATAAKAQSPVAESTLPEGDTQVEKLGKSAEVSNQGYVLHLVSSDETFANELAASDDLPMPTVEVRDLAEAGRISSSSGQSAKRPIVLVDLREGQATLEDVASIHDDRPAIPIVALVDRVVPVSQVYAVGALAAMPAEVEAVAACVQNIQQSQKQFASLSPTVRPLQAVRGSGVARLRRVFGDLRSGLLSATVALNLMHIISESVERAVLFLVRQNCLQALGAFGLGEDGSPLAELTRGLRLDLEEPSVLADSLNSGEAVTLRFGDALLPDRLKNVLGRPLTGQIVVFPVLGAQRVISVIYTDNGQVDRPIEDIEILELATAQVGMAFENELLRRQISRQDF